MGHGSVAASNAGTLFGVKEEKEVSPAKQISNLALYGKTHPTEEDIRRHREFLVTLHQK